MILVVLPWPHQHDTQLQSKIVRLSLVHRASSSTVVPDRMATATTLCGDTSKLQTCFVFDASYAYTKRHLAEPCFDNWSNS
eukprot:11952-Amphidinium_carterae.1